MKKYFLLFIAALLLTEAGLFASPQGNVASKPTLIMKESKIQVINQGARLLASGKSLEAEGILSDAVIANPDSPEAFYNYGLALSFNGKMADAIHAYLKAIELKFAFPEAHLAIGDVYLGMGEPGEALKAFDTVLAIASDQVELSQSALHNKGVALVKLGRNDEAKMCFIHLLALNPDDSAAAFHLGKLLFKAGRFSEALSPLAMARSEFPIEAGFFLAKTWKALNEKEKADNLFLQLEKDIQSAELASETRQDLLEEIKKERYH